MTDETTVLYVDSDPGSLEAAVETFERETDGVLVVTAESAADGYDELHQQPVDCVVSGDELPDEDAVEFLTDVHSAYPTIPTILFTGQGSEGIIREAFDTGVTDCIQKAGPEQYLVLAHRVANTVSQQRSIDALRENERQYRTLTDAISDVIVLIDESSTIRFINDAVADVFGYTADELLGESLTTLMSDEMARQHRSAIERYLAEGERHLDWNYLELPGRHKDGYEVPLGVSFGEFTRDGERFFTGLMRDITERKLAEQALEHERDLKDRLMEGLPVGVLVFDQNGKASYVNPQGEEILGRPEDELVGMYFSATEWGLADLDGNPIPDEAKPVQRVLDTGEELIDEKISIEQPTGNRVLLSVNHAPIFDESGDVNRVIVTFEDITEEKRLKRELEDLLGRVTDSFLSVDTSWRFTYVNERAEELLGRSEGELLGKRIWDEYPEAAEMQFKEQYERAMETQEPVGFEEYYPPLDIWFGIRAYPSETGLSVYFRDITDRKQREMEIESQRQKQEVVAELGRRALGGEDLSMLMQDACQFVADILDHEYCDVLEYVPDDDHLYFREAVGWEEDVVENTAMRTETDSKPGYTLLSNEPVVTTDFETEDRFSSELLQSRDVTSSISVGIGSPDDPWGIFGVHTTTQRQYTESDVTFVQSVANVLATAISRRQYEDRLAAINEETRQLLLKETADDVANAVVKAAETAINQPLSMVALYDDETGDLRPNAYSEQARAVLEDETVLDPNHSWAWQPFLENETRVYTDLAAELGIERDTPLQSAAVVPLDQRGVFVTFTTDSEFEPLDIDLAQLLASDAVAVLDRIEREQELKARDKELQERNEALTRLNRINDVIRELDQALVQATSRAEIERAVVERLASAEPYTFVWIGDHDAVSEIVSPREMAGEDDGYLNTVTITTGEEATGQGPIGMAVRTQEPQVVQDIFQASSFEPWREEAMKRGFRSVISIPLAYEDSLYGVLTIYTDEPSIFDEMEQSVLAELGQTIAHAINAVETKRALLMENVVELELRVKGQNGFLQKLAGEVDCEIDFENVVLGAGGEANVFFAVRNAPADRVREVAEGFVSTSDVELISERDGVSRFEATVSGKTIPTTIINHGAVPRTITTDGTEATVILELPHDADVRTFIEMLQEKYPDTELVARREHSRPTQTTEEFKAEFEDRLTDRQLDALRTAYFAGFFDWPRESTGQEVADLLNVAQPTFNHHLRAGEHKLFSMLFEK